ncbi:MAG: hypothetical protein AAF539_16540, partial [Planctomycetota bacterium]
MWPLTDGNHCLQGAEADLFRGAVGMMVDQLVLEINEEPDETIDVDPMPMEDAMSAPYLYTMWSPAQRVWLLERVTFSVLSSRRPPPASAIFEATVEAVYAEVGDLVALEICEGSSISESSWRQSLLNAFVSRCPQDSLLEAMQFEVTAMDPCLPPSIAEKLRVIGNHPPDAPDTETETAGSNSKDGRQRD